MDDVLSHPWTWTLSPIQFTEDIAGNKCVFADLKIEHAYVDKVGAVFKSEFESLIRMYRPGGEDLKSNPGLLYRSHKLYRILRS